VPLIAMLYTPPLREFKTVSHVMSCQPHHTFPMLCTANTRKPYIPQSRTLKSVKSVQEGSKKTARPLSLQYEICIASYRNDLKSHHRTTRQPRTTGLTAGVSRSEAIPLHPSTLVLHQASAHPMRVLASVPPKPP
jgi:hypothetical protein